MNKSIWRARLFRSSKTKTTEVYQLWRPLPSGEYLRISPTAAPVDVQDLLCMLPESGAKLMVSKDEPVVLDFRKQAKEAGKSCEFFKTFYYARSRQKQQLGLLADCSFEVTEPTAGFSHVRFADFIDLPTVEQQLQAGQQLAEELLEKEFPKGLPKKSTHEQDRRYAWLRTAVGLPRKPMANETKPSTWAYCAYCGNAKVPDRARPCNHCFQILRNDLSIAWEVYKTLQDETSQCCGGLSRGKDHLSFHGNHWNGTYPKKKESGCGSTTVDMGVNLYRDRAETYWVFDDDSTTEGNDYGEAIPYSDPKFWEKLNAQLDQAPEHAWNSDICSCEHCGYHYHVGNGPCGCSGSEEEDEE